MFKLLLASLLILKVLVSVIPSAVNVLDSLLLTRPHCWCFEADAGVPAVAGIPAIACIPAIAGISALYSIPPLTGIPAVTEPSYPHRNVDASNPSLKTTFMGMALRTKFI
jgi:hypothetical protein